MEGPSPTLTGIPMETRGEILSWLSYKDALACAFTCNAMNDAYVAVPGVWYRQRLHSCGSLDNPTCTWPSSSRRELLKFQEDAWRHPITVFPDGEPREIPFGTKLSDIYAISPTMLLSHLQNYSNPTAGINGEDAVQVTTFPIQVPTGGDGSLSGTMVPRSSIWNMQFSGDVIGLCSAVEEHGYMAWVIAGPNARNNNVADVCVIFEPVDGIENSSPSLQRPISWGFDILVGDEDFSMLAETSIEAISEISGQNMALTLNYEMEDQEGNLLPCVDLYIMAWQTGDSKIDGRKLSMAVSCGGLAFLAEDILLNPCTLRNRLNVYAIDSIYKDFDPDCETEQSIDTTLVCSLALPMLATGNRISAIHCKSNPNPTARNRVQKELPEFIPFVDNPSKAIVAFKIVIESEANDNGATPRTWYFWMAVRRSALREIAVRERNDNVVDSRTIPWDEWGPNVTWWRSATDSSPPQVWGQRMVLPELYFNERGEIEPNRKAVGLANFAPKMRTDSRKPSPTETAEESVTRLDHAGAFQGDVFSRLHCSSPLTEHVMNGRRILFDGKRLVAEEVVAGLDGQDTINFVPYHL
ncbi:hypothetical protein M413DRAFT_29796 [Hebeloma cylindrosporum]|uniref:F-box domain-containing protein n=1 Tax=Hebeloma cylindrosporum TaxID=76867 RepID=A0A0C3BQC1_HEBCY|nr:hypothetical protein M413DRAFT_29796 [Hebeloma cylindrosporum h7]